MRSLFSNVKQFWVGEALIYGQWVILTYEGMSLVCTTIEQQREKLLTWHNSTSDCIFLKLHCDLTIDNSSVNLISGHNNVTYICSDQQKLKTEEPWKRYGGCAVEVSQVAQGTLQRCWDNWNGLRASTERNALLAKAQWRWWMLSSEC